jgi:uncharacterized protein YndB with AHSA1/START domain
MRNRTVAGLGLLYATVKLHEETEAERRVERETLLPASPAEVWEALTDPGRLEEWLASEVELDPVEGGEVSVRDEGGERTGTVETVIEEERLSFTWARPGAEPSRVDLIVEAIPAGTRLVVVETASGPAALAGAARARLDGWGYRLGRLTRLLALAPVA